MKLALMIVGALSLGLPAPAGAQTSPAQFAATTLTLSAIGEVAAAPDLATVSFGVTAQAPTAAQALGDNSQEMSSVITALHGLGVQDRDIRTSGLNVQAQYAFKEGQPRRLTGYQALNQVSVTVQDLARLGALVDAVVAAGANDVGGVRFALKNPQTAEDQARQEAVRALKAKADLYAQASGYRVARLVNLSEGARPAPVSYDVEEVVVTASRKAPPVSSGELSVKVEVNAVYELTR